MKGGDRGSGGKEAQERKTGMGTGVASGLSMKPGHVK